MSRVVTFDDAFLLMFAFHDAAFASLSWYLDCLGRRVFRRVLTYYGAFFSSLTEEYVTGVWYHYPLAATAGILSPNSLHSVFVSAMVKDGEGYPAQMSTSAVPTNDVDEFDPESVE